MFLKKLKNLVKKKPSVIGYVQFFDFDYSELYFEFPEGQYVEKSTRF